MNEYEKMFTQKLREINNEDSQEPLIQEFLDDVLSSFSEEKISMNELIIADGDYKRLRLNWVKTTIPRRSSFFNTIIMLRKSAMSEHAINAHRLTNERLAHLRVLQELFPRWKEVTVLRPCDTAAAADAEFSCAKCHHHVLTVLENENYAVGFVVYYSSCEDED